MKLTTKQIKQMIMEELAAMKEMYGPSPGLEGGNDPMQALYDQGLQDARDGKEPQPHMTGNSDYMQGYDDGRAEAEGDIEDEQTYVRGPYGEM